MIKILYYFFDLDSLMYRWQHYHIIEELRSHGIEIEIFNPLSFSSVDEANNNVISYLRNKRIDLFMTPVKDGILYPETIKQIKEMGIQTLLICFDNLTVPFNHKHTAKLYDLVWLTSKETEYLFKKWGANTVFLPYAANPNIIKPNFENFETDSVLFIGTPYGSRCKTINNLIDNNIPLHLFGNIKANTDNHFIPNVPKQQLIKSAYHMLSYPIGRKLALASIINKLTSKSEIRLNSKYLKRCEPVDLITMMNLYTNYALSLSSVTNRHTGILKKPVFVTNLRSFEIPASAGLLFCQYNPELNEYFVDNKEAVYYYDEEDMIDKARYYLSPKRINERRRMKINARRKVESDHNWFARFSVIFQKLNIVGR